MKFNVVFHLEGGTSFYTDYLLEDVGDYSAQVLADSVFKSAKQEPLLWARKFDDNSAGVLIDTSKIVAVGVTRIAKK